MGDPPYISSEEGGELIMRSWLIYANIPYISILYMYLYKNFQPNEGGGLIMYHGIIIRIVLR